MRIWSDFQKQILKNYIAGSLIAVFGVGGVLVFHTLYVSGREVYILLLIMLLSCICMFTSEWFVYREHIRPIQAAFLMEKPALSVLQDAYTAALRFPLATIRRILGPHLLGLSVPAASLAALAIEQELLHIPYYYIALAAAGAVLVAAVHGLIEFFLTYASVEPLIQSVLERAEQLYNVRLEPNQRHLVSMKKKLLLSSTFIAVFPILLFSLAFEIHLNQGPSGTNYWEWSLLILLMVVLLASFGSRLLYQHISRPIEALETSMVQVQNGLFIPLGNVYSDEFAHLVTGFNHMMTGIQARDEENERLIESFFTVFAATLDARDPYTAGHSIRVADYSVRIAEEAGLPPEQVDLLRKSALLHDIGKIGVRDDVLLKEGKLTDEEFAQIKQHPSIGTRILEMVDLPEGLQPVLPGVRHHHERFDGKGYPDGLQGLEIPLFGRIMAVADAYDAMTSDRPYRKGMPVQRALSILYEGKGTQWDPAYVDIWIRLMTMETAEQEQTSLAH
ncbi:HD domain-containing phosphohydrolase [Ectobacillus ponti]|uniref:HD domain-containing protein n=1 Tax=Ectobacillus ponti TaxID=2961894 RepID=A0AA41X7T7_9BACI|nr:HD domain-containing phosphohydrolase [Ectobacillus ponti]MCP8970397.1 HD domain-containing protein [Ectobacillus ponti]